MFALPNIGIRATNSLNIFIPLYYRYPKRRKRVLWSISKRVDTNQPTFHRRCGGSNKVHRLCERIFCSWNPLRPRVGDRSPEVCSLSVHAEDGVRTSTGTWRPSEEWLKWVQDDLFLPRRSLQGYRTLWVKETHVTFVWLSNWKVKISCGLLFDLKVI